MLTLAWCQDKAQRMVKNENIIKIEWNQYSLDIGNVKVTMNFCATQNKSKKHALSWIMEAEP